MFNDNFVLIGLDWLTKTQVESWFAADGRRTVYVSKPADINADSHRNCAITYVINLSRISSYASDVLAKISEFYGTTGVFFVVLADKRPPKLLKKLKFKTLELHWE